METRPGSGLLTSTSHSIRSGSFRPSDGINPAIGDCRGARAVNADYGSARRVRARHLAVTVARSRGRSQPRLNVPQ